VDLVRRRSKRLRAHEGQHGRLGVRADGGDQVCRGRQPFKPKRCQILIEVVQCVRLEDPDERAGRFAGAVGELSEGAARVRRQLLERMELAPAERLAEAPPHDIIPATPKALRLRMQCK
jgi:hypothetical protein